MVPPRARPPRLVPRRIITSFRRGPVSSDGAFRLSHILDDVPHRLIPVGGVGVRASLDDGAQSRSIGDKVLLAGEDVVEDEADLVYVVDRAEVPERPQGRIYYGAFHRGARAREVRVLLLGEPEVGDLDHERIAAPIRMDEHISVAEVAVAHATPVQEVHRVQELHRHLVAGLVRHLLDVVRDVVPQRVLAVLHRVAVVRIVVAVDLQDVGEVEPFHDVELPAEPLDLLGVRVLLQPLARDLDAVVRVGEPIDERIGPFSDELKPDLFRSGKRRPALLSLEHRVVVFDLYRREPLRDGTPARGPEPSARAVDHFLVFGLGFDPYPGLGGDLQQSGVCLVHLHQVTAGVGVEVAAHALRRLGVHELEGAIVTLVQPSEDAPEPLLPVIQHEVSFVDPLLRELAQVIVQLPLWG